MKRLVLVFIVLIITFVGAKAQQDTIYSQEKDKFLQKLVFVIDTIKIHEDVNVKFSNHEMNNLIEGNVVKKEKLIISVPVALVPVVKVSTPVIISSFKKGEDRVVKKIGENTDYLYPRKSWGITIAWIYIPLISIFVLAYSSIKKRKSGRKAFIIFSFITTIFLIITMYISNTLGSNFGTYFGLIFGIISAIIAEKNINSTIGFFFGVLTTIFAGVFMGIFAIEFTDPKILWQYIILYFGICVLAFLFREVIVKRHKKIVS
ncbi:hypothetical protein K9M50_02450 [Patescibacteria group bacterium]|nr:hypothetical protein [Patescibacteria group bacterium]